MQHSIRRHTKGFRFITALWLCGMWGCSGVPDAGDTVDTLQIANIGESSGARPLFAQVQRYSTRVDQTGLRTDFYFPLSGGDGEDGQSFPLAFYLQGGNVNNALYSDFASRVAAYGFIVAVVNQEGLFGALADISTFEGTRQFVASEHEAPESPLAGVWLDSAVAIVGHSFGGVAALDAVQGVCRFPFCRGGFERPANLAAVSGYGTNQCGPTGCEDSLIENDGIAVQLIQGSIDGLAELPDTQDTFERIRSGPRQLLTVNGANHYGLTNVNNPEGSAPDPNLQTIDQRTSIETVARWTGTFLRAYLLDDEAALAYIAGGGIETDPNIAAVFVP